MRFIGVYKKSARTLNQRGFSFAEATRVFDDPLRLIERARTKDGEDRWLTIGIVTFDSGPPYIAVIYTEREIDAKTAIRIISARAANRKEREIAKAYTN